MVNVQVVHLGVAARADARADEVLAAHRVRARQREGRAQRQRVQVNVAVHVVRERVAHDRAAVVALAGDRHLAAEQIDLHVRQLLAQLGRVAARRVGLVLLLRGHVLRVRNVVLGAGERHPRLVHGLGLLKVVRLERQLVRAERLVHAVLAAPEGDLEHGVRQRRHVHEAALLRVGPVRLDRQAGRAGRLLRVADALLGIVVNHCARGRKVMGKKQRQAGQRRRGRERKSEVKWMAEGAQSRERKAERRFRTGIGD